MSHDRDAAYALLRVTLGVICLTTGIVKCMAEIGNFVAGLHQEFTGKLPLVLVTPFAYGLPCVEVTLGVLLVLGLFTEVALVIAGWLVMVLTFGKTAVNDAATVAGNLSYVLIIFVLLWLADSNGYSLDRKRKREVPSHRT